MCSAIKSQIGSSYDADLSSNADAVWRPNGNDDDDGPAYFVKPMEIDEPFSDFIDYVSNQEKSKGGLKNTENVKYSQARE